MDLTPKFAFFIILFCIFAFFLVDLGYTSFVQSDVNGSVESALRGSMQQSINKGYLRVNEEMSIDKDKFIQNYKSIYKNNQSMLNANERTEFYQASENPPMAAVEVLSRSNSFFKRLMGEDATLNYYKKQVVILEKK